MPGRTKEPPKEGTRQRRWRTPQPLIGDASGPGPEGLVILDEIQSELGWVLGKTLRSVILWSQVEPQARAELFDVAAADRRSIEILSTVPAEEVRLREALEALLPVLSTPERADPEAVGIACTRISSWAEDQGAPRSSLEFMQAAALACPANARFALQVGQASRDLAQYGRAEAWLQRAVGLARQVNDWESYVRAYLAHGTMMMRRGALPAARRSFLKAQRRATRQGIRRLEAMAFHDLFVLEAYSGAFGAALDYAERAARAYGHHAARLPAFAHDVAHFWVEQGHYDHAVPIFQEALDRGGESHRPFVLGSLARAFGGLKDRDGFDWVFQEMSRIAPAPGLAESWVEVARGAILLGEHEGAKQAARRAETVAEERGEGQIRFMAQAVLENAEAEARAVAAPPESDVGEPDESRTAVRRATLTREIIRTLRSLEPVG